MTEALATGDGSSFIKIAKSSKGYKPLNLVALQYAIEGITTMEEVLRISADMDVPLDDDQIQTSEGTMV